MTSTTEETATPVVPPQVETINKKINHLGSECPTADDVAAFFTDLGIKGYPGESASCPVAVWLKEEIGDDDYLCVGTYASGWLGDLSQFGTHSPWKHFTAHPQQVTEFVQNFDTGRYPHLVAER